MPDWVYSWRSRPPGCRLMPVLVSVIHKRPILVYNPPALITPMQLTTEPYKRVAGL